MNLHVQLSTLLAMAGCGLGMGAVYDAYGVIAARLRFRRWLYAVCDLLYWLLLIPVVFRVLYLNNAGEMRLYVFLGLGIGVCLHLLLFSSFVRRVVRMLIRVVEWLWAALNWLFRMLIVKPLLMLIAVVWAVLGIGWKVAVFAWRVMIKCLYPFTWVYRLAAARFEPPLRRLAARTLGPAWNWGRRLWDRSKRQNPPEPPPSDVPPKEPD